MRASKARLIRKAVYRGTDNYRTRTYKQLDNGQVVADIQRSVYQLLKKECQYMTHVEIKKYLKAQSQRNQALQNS